MSCFRRSSFAVALSLASIVLVQSGRAQDTKPPAAPKADDPKRFDRFGYALHEHEVTIAGRATNERNEPVAGARVFIIPVIPNGVPYGDLLKIIAEGQTDREGRYRFEKVKLPVLEFRPQAVPKPTEGRFQVYAIRNGLGLVWRRPQIFRPGARPPSLTGVINDNGNFQTIFFDGEPIEVDLTFSPEVLLHGRITDDFGTPLKDAVVQVGLVSTTRSKPGSPPNTWGLGYAEGSERAIDLGFQGFQFLPEAYRAAQTDAEGRYEIRGLPRDCEMLCFIDALPEHDPFGGSLSTASTSAAQQARGYRFVGYEGKLDHTFTAPRRIRVRVLTRDEWPLTDAVVRLESNRTIRRKGSLARSDLDGIAILQALPGTSDLIIEPTFGQPWLPVRRNIEIQGGAEEQSLVIALDPAVEVQFEAVEKETGKPVVDVAFLSEPADARERTPVQSQLSFVDHPRTDDAGRQRAFFPPGKRIFRVAAARPGAQWEPVAPVSEALELTAGKPTRVRFEFLRRATSPPGDAPVPAAAELKPLFELLQRQNERYAAFRTAKYRIRRNNYLVAPLTRETLTRLFDTFVSKSVEECFDAFTQQFPDFKGVSEEEIVVDGPKFRVLSTYRGQPPGIHVHNGEETMTMQFNEQLDIFGRENTTIGTVSPRDFWPGPANPRLIAAPNSPAGEAPRMTFRHEAGRWRIELVLKQGTRRLEIDDATGFEYVGSFESPSYAEETRQFFPTRLPGGLAAPRLTIKCRYQGDKLNRAEITLIDAIEPLDRLPPDTFLMAASAGTNVIDYRGIPRDRNGGGRPPSGVLYAPVIDVVAYRNRFPLPGPPILKVGDKAPELQVAGWLTAAGMAPAPPLAGKIVVIDFWAVTCGPCVGQLGEIIAAADHFAGSEVAIVGLHDASGTIDEVAAFAKKRGLNFPLAIDKAAAGFGATFAAWGVDAIPTCAVIDRDGNVAYLGEFERGIEVANGLVKRPATPK